MSRSRRRGTRSASTRTRSPRSAARRGLCRAAGVTVEAYLAHYDPTAALPFPGVRELLGRLDRWGLASNKERPRAARARAPRVDARRRALLRRLRRRREGAGPAARRHGLDARGVVFVGDTRHDRACAAAVGAAVRPGGLEPPPELSAEAGDLVLDHPKDVLGLLPDACSTDTN